MWELWRDFWGLLFWFVGGTWIQAPFGVLSQNYIFWFISQTAEKYGQTKNTKVWFCVSAAEAEDKE